MKDLFTPEEIRTEIARFTELLRVPHDEVTTKALNDALKQLNKLNVNRHNLPSLKLLGLAYDKLGDGQKTIRCFKIVATETPEDLLAWDGYIGKLISYDQLKEAEVAIQDLRQKNLNNPDALSKADYYAAHPKIRAYAQRNMMMGQILSQQAPAPSAPPAAELAFDDLIKDAQDCYYQGNYAGALGLFNQALSLGKRPHDIGYPLILRGLAHVALNNPALCFADFDAAKSFFKNASPKAQAEYLEKRGFAHRVFQQEKEAKDCFTKAVKCCDLILKDKKSAHLHSETQLKRADLYKKLGEDKKAFKDLVEMARSIIPKGSPNYATAAGIERASKERKANIADLFEQLRQVVDTQLNSPVVQQPVAPSVSFAGSAPMQAPGIPKGSSLNSSSSDESNSPPRQEINAPGSARIMRDQGMFGEQPQAPTALLDTETDFTQTDIFKAMALQMRNEWNANIPTAATNRLNHLDREISKLNSELHGPRASK